jgi:hypothetical protein
MTAVSLFDLLARSDGSAPGASNRLAPFADRLVEAILADLDRLRRDEQAVLAERAGDEDDGLDLELARSLWSLYSEWARDAEQVLSRVRAVRAGGNSVRDLEQLEDTYGSVRARLSVSPERLIQSRQQIRNGSGVPAGELRDELRARIRA